MTPEEIKMLEQARMARRKSSSSTTASPACSRGALVAESDSSRGALVAESVVPTAEDTGTSPATPEVIPSVIGGERSGEAPVVVAETMPLAREEPGEASGQRVVELDEIVPPRQDESDNGVAVVLGGSDLAPIPVEWEVGEILPTDRAEGPPPRSEAAGAVEKSASPPEERPRKRPREEEGDSERMGEMQVAAIAPPTGLSTPSRPGLSGLQSAAGFLASFLSEGERKYVREEGAQYLVQGALQSLARMGHCLAAFAAYSSESSSLELAVARERIDHLEFRLEQEKTASSELAKEADASETALGEARDALDRKEMELLRARQRIKDLEEQRSRAERSCRRACDDMDHLRRLLREDRGASRSCEPGTRRDSSQRSGDSTRSSVPAIPSVSELERAARRREVELEDHLLRRVTVAERTANRLRINEDRFITKGAEIIQRACKTAFSAGFERCKKTVGAAIPSGDVGRLKITFPDKGLEVVVDDSLGSFRKMATEASSAPARRDDSVAQAGKNLASR